MERERWRGRDGEGERERGGEGCGGDKARRFRVSQPSCRPMRMFFRSCTEWGFGTECGVPPQLGERDRGEIPHVGCWCLSVLISNLGQHSDKSKSLLGIVSFPQTPWCLTAGPLACKLLCS